MELLSAICIIAAGILWGTMGIFVRYLSAWGFSTLQITAFRIIIGAIMFLVFLAVTDRKRLKIRRKDIWLFAGMGVGSIFLMSVSYFTTMQLASLSVAAILLYTAPVFVMIMSILFLKEKLSANKLVALLAAFAGCVLVTGIGGSRQIGFYAILMGLLSGFSYALYSILGSVALKRYHPYTVSAYAFVFAAVAELIVCRPSEAVKSALRMPHPGMVFLVMAAMALCTAFLPYLLYTFGLKRVEAGKAAILATVEPLVATLIGVLVFEEPLNTRSLFGVILILLAIAILNNFGRRKSE